MTSNNHDSSSCVAFTTTGIMLTTTGNARYHQNDASNHHYRGTTSGTLFTPRARRGAAWFQESHQYASCASSLPTTNKTITTICTRIKSEQQEEWRRLSLHQIIDSALEVLEHVEQDESTHREARNNGGSSSSMSTKTIGSGVPPQEKQDENAEDDEQDVDIR